MKRRDFIKISAAGAAAAGAVSMGCSPKKQTETVLGEVPVGKMTYRKDPRTGEDISLLGYGCMRWPMTKNNDEEEVIDQEAVNELVDYAIAHGVNYFDTAPGYLRGKSEEATAEALSRHPRESYYLATKLSNFADPSFKAAMEMYETSFRRLRTDYLDYYLLHSLSSYEGYQKRFIENGLLDFLLKERKKGTIRHLGFSFHGDIDAFKLLLKEHDDYLAKTGDVLWDFVQIQMNWMDWNHAGRGRDASLLYPELENRNIPCVIMEPLLGGRLASVPQHVAARLKEMNPAQSVASWAFRFAGSPEGMLTVLSGMTYMDHLQDNIRTYSPLVPLSEKELDYLEKTAEIMSQFQHVPCTDCKYCMPCPYGIDIPSIFAHYNKCVNEGYVSADSQDENYAKNRRAYLVSYDRAIPKLRQADRCIGCGQCLVECPQKIDIPKELHRIDKYIDKMKKGSL